MKILNKIRTMFSDDRKRVTPYEDFWNWFKGREKEFHRVIKLSFNVDGNFFVPLGERLNRIRHGYAFEVCMNHDDVAELVLTAEGKIKNIVFVEDLVAAAPVIKGWTFVASKQAGDATGSVSIGGFDFNCDNLFFYADEQPSYPDCINLTVIHDDYTMENDEQMVMGIYLFLDSYLGEVRSVTVIDYVNVTGRAQAEKELIPIGKLKDFIEWREKEFVERYDGIMYDRVNDNFSVLGGHTVDGQFLMISVNMGLLNWEGTVSHPFILKFVFDYEGEENGLPASELMTFMDDVEDDLTDSLPGDGCLNVGRETGANKRIVYYACRDFREPARVAEQVSERYGRAIETSWDIYKDKYWQSLESFKVE
jgi:hypothetical protein